MKKAFSILIMLVLLMTSVVVLPVTSALADSWPVLSKSSYCEFVADKTIEVFTDIGLRTRGTSNPKKAYNAYVDPGDVCKAYQVSSKPYVLISYPTPSGIREGYVRRSDVFPGSAPSAKVIAKGSANSYKTAGGAYSGYTEAGDETWRFGEKKGYYAVVYTAISGSRRYKLAWIKKADYETGVLGKTNTVTKHLRGVPNYKQYDSRWANVMISTTNLANAGCLITSMAMSESYRQGKSITPDKMRNSFSFDGNNMYWPSNYYRIASGKGTDALQAVYDTITAGKPVIVGGECGRSEHWVLIYGYTNANRNNLSAGNFEINDPNSTSRTTLQAFLNDYGSDVVFKTYR